MRTHTPLFTRTLHITAVISFLCFAALMPLQSNAEEITSKNNQDLITQLQQRIKELMLQVQKLQNSSTKLDPMWVNPNPKIEKAEIKGLSVELTTILNRNLEIIPNSNNDQPLESCGSSKTGFTIHWGDGKSDELLRYGCNATNRTISEHLYMKNGTYTITIKNKEGVSVDAYNAKVGENNEKPPVGVPPIEKYEGKITSISNEERPVLRGVATAQSRVRINFVQDLAAPGGSGPSVTVYKSPRINPGKNSKWNYQLSKSVLKEGSHYRVVMTVNGEEVHSMSYTHKKDPSPDIPFPPNSVEVNINATVVQSSVSGIDSATLLKLYNSLQNLQSIVK